MWVKTRHLCAHSFPLEKAPCDRCCSQLQRPWINAEVPEVWGHTEMRRDRLWPCFEVSLVYFTQQGKYIFKIPLGFCFLLGSSSPRFPLWCQHVFPRFGLSHPWKCGDYRAWRGWWGSPGCGESREGSEPLRISAWEGFAGGKLSWECEFPSGADVLSSHPSRLAKHSLSQASGRSGDTRGWI